MKNSNKTFTSYITGKGLTYLINKYLLPFTPDRLLKEINKRFREKINFKEMLYNINSLKVANKNKITFVPIVITKVKNVNNSQNYLRWGNTGPLPCGRHVNCCIFLDHFALSTTIKCINIIWFRKSTFKIFSTKILF